MGSSPFKRRPPARRARKIEHPRRRRAVALVVAQVAALVVVVTVAGNRAEAATNPVMFGYIPQPANEMATSMSQIRAGAGTTLDFTVGITNAGSGAVLTYDEWEDGYEANIGSPTQASTLVFGDNDDTNGDAQDFCAACVNDSLPQGAPLIMRNDVVTPRPANNAPLRFDGKDKVASTRGFAITAGGFTTTRGSLQAAVVSSYDTTKYATAYTVPVGTDTPVPAGATNPFAYTATLVQASQDDTVVQVDSDADGVPNVSQSIDEGEVLHTTAIREGATIRSSKPVQVHLYTGDTTADYEMRSFTLFPDSTLTSDYLSPAGANDANFATTNFLFNPNDAEITVTPTCTGCSGTLLIQPGESAAYNSPIGRAVQFESTGGERFIGIAGVGAHSGVGPSADNSSSWDWGFTMIPTSQLTSQVVLGWAPGNSNANPANPAANRDDDPVWVSSMEDTIIRVDLDGNPNTGAIGTADCFGSHDMELPVSALTSTRIFDNVDGSMTGARIYTCNEVLIAAAWGEDPQNAPTGSPGFDAGYTVIPSTTMIVDKTAAIAEDPDGNGRFSPGDTVTYSVSIADAGNLAFTNVDLSDTLQDGMTYVPNSTQIDDGSSIDDYPDDTGAAATPFPFDENGNSLPTIQAGQTIIVSFDVVVDAPYLQTDGTLANTACVTAQEADGCDTSEEELVEADLSLTKDVTGNPQRVGDQATFLLTVENAGPDSASAIEVTDVLPDGVTYVSNTPSQGTYDDATGIWSVGTVDAGDDATLEVVVTIDRTSVTNVAEITNAAAFDPDSQPAEGPLDDGQNPPDQDDEDIVTVTVNPALIDLSLAKTVTDVGDHVGDQATFDVVIRNDGPSVATGVVVADRLPAGLSLVSGSATQGTWNAQTRNWSVGTLAVGQEETLTVVATVTSPDVQTNVAEVIAANQGDADSTPNNDVLAEDDQDDAQVDVDPLIDLEVDKSVLTEADYVGDDATFRITVTNNGPSPATGVVVTDRPGSGLDLSSASNGAFDPGTGVWNVGNLAVGQSVSVDVTGAVLSTSTQNLVEVTAANEDDVDSQPAENPLNSSSGPNQDDEDGVNLTADPQADLRLTKEETGTATHVGDQTSFRITVSNDGPSDATDIEVTDLLPAGLTYVSHQTSQGDYDEATGIWNVGDLDAPDEATLDITVVVNVTDVTNFAQITDQGEHDPDSEPGENPLDEQTPPDQDDEDEALVQVDPLVDVWLEKAATAAPTYVGGQARFDITVGNDGPSTATGIVVRDQLPNGLSYVSHTADQGDYDEATGLWTVGDLDPGGNVTLTVVADVDDDGTITNRAEVIVVDQDDVDSTPNNDDPGEDDQDLAEITVAPLVDLSLTKTLLAEPTHVGDAATFRITVANAGPSDATGVVVEDLLPAGLTFVDSTVGAAYDAATGEWTVGTIQAGQSSTIDIDVTVDAETTENFAQVVDVNEDDVDSEPAENPLDAQTPPDQDDEDSVPVDVSPTADLSLVKMQTASPEHLGDTATFTITVRNDGPSTAHNVEVTDELPAGLANVDAQTTQGTYDTATGIWQVGDLDNDESATLTINATVTASPVHNVAEVTAVDEDDPDSQPGEDPLDPQNPPNQDDEGEAIVEVAPLIDLSLAKQLLGSGDHVGDAATFRITISNDGPSAATGVTVSDPLPAGLEFVSSDPSVGSYDSASGTWTVGDMSESDSATLDLVVIVNTPDPVTNTAQVSAAEQDDVDSTPGNSDPAEDDQGDATVDVDPLIDLSLDKSVSQAPTYVGDEATYRLVVSNEGPSAATGVQVTDQLPAGVTFVSATSPDYNPTTGVWNVGSLAAGGSRQLEITVEVTALSSTNFAQVTAANEDDVDSQPAEGPLNGANPPNQDDEDQAVLTVDPLIDLSLTKTSSPDSVSQLDDATFTITVRNDGPSVATGVAVTDQLPEGVELVDQDASQGTYDPATGVWTIGTIGVGDEATLDLQVHVTGAGDITNTAQVTAANEDDVDSTPANGDPAEDDQDSTMLSSDPVIDLEVEKTASDDTVLVGDEVTYTVTVTNDGPSDATGVELTDELPAGVDYVSHDPSVGSYSPGTGVWTIGDLDVGDSATLRVVAEVIETGDITNAAEVSAADQDDVDSEPAEGPLDAANPPDQDDEAVAVVTGVEMDLELGIDVDVTNVNVGDPATYTVTLTNQGPSGATGVTVAVPLPAGLTFVSSNPEVGAYDPATGTWTVGNLAVGETVTLELVTTVVQPGPITVVAQVDAANEPDIDSTPGNDDATEDDQDEVLITGIQADLSLTKEVSDDAPVLGGTTDYTLTVRNDGPSDATGVLVIDKLPAGLEFIEAAATQGDYDPETGEWTVGDLANQATADLVITVQVNVVGTTTNTAWIGGSDQPDPDSTPDPEDPGPPTEDDHDSVPLTPIPASLEGVVWLDTDGDGVFDADETPIPGVRIQLLDDSGDIVAVTVTDEDGVYLFVDLMPGTYTVVVDETTLPATISGQTYDPDDVVDSSHEVTLEAGQNVVDIDFGYQEGETVNGELPPADLTPPAEGGSLVRTGITIGGLLGLGLVLIAAGWFVLAQQRRRFARR